MYFDYIHSLLPVTSPPLLRPFPFTCNFPCTFMPLSFVIIAYRNLNEQLFGYTTKENVSPPATINCLDIFRGVRC